MRKPTARARMKRPRARRSASAMVAGGCQRSSSFGWPEEAIGRPWKTGLGVSGHGNSASERSVVV
jgi:hypothetical protein